MFKKLKFALILFGLSLLAVLAMPPSEAEAAYCRIDDQFGGLVIFRTGPTCDAGVQQLDDESNGWCAFSLNGLVAFQNNGTCPEGWINATSTGGAFCHWTNNANVIYQAGRSAGDCDTLPNLPVPTGLGGNSTTGGTGGSSGTTGGTFGTGGTYSGGAVAVCASGQSFFNFPTWYKYLQCDDNGLATQNFELKDIWLVAVAVLEIILRVVGILGVVFVIVGGFRYVTSQGNPEGTSKARKTILNAIAGLAMAIVASSTVALVMNILAGGDGSTFGSGSGNTNAIQDILNLVYAVGGGVAVTFVVIGGYNYVTSTGDPQKITNARNTIVYAIIGAIVIAFATVITAFVANSV